MPTTARPYPVMAMAGNNGAIFQAHSAVMLFEEPVARSVGDVLTVEISESLESTGKDNTTLSRTGSVTNTGSADDTVPGFIRELLRSNTFAGSGDNQFKGKGSFETKKGVTATLAVTVIDVLPNGNLLIGGDKRVSVNDQQSILRLTGVLNRKDVKAGNVVSSKKIADARLELVGQGVIADANNMSWMQRLFLSVLSPL
ncbi:MAG: flagellar biosynthesis protein FlgH [Proteobacteria bacterium]|nr:flagellar biosynthesis protein FlgH [Pseudomonadota bacterium]